ncbi:unnamed protein product, partial [Scytosiphon promiscuus]
MLVTNFGDSVASTAFNTPPRAATTEAAVGARRARRGLAGRGPPFKSRPAREHRAYGVRKVRTAVSNASSAFPHQARQIQGPKAGTYFSPRESYSRTRERHGKIPQAEANKIRARKKKARTDTARRRERQEDRRENAPMGMTTNTANLPIAAGAAGEREPLATGAPTTATAAFSAAMTAPRASHRFGPIDMMRGAAPSDTAAAAAAAAAKVPRRLDSADLAHLSSDGSSSRSSSNATADDGGWGSYQDSSKRKGFSLGQVPAFVGQDYGDEDWRE